MKTKFLLLLMLMIYGVCYSQKKLMISAPKIKKGYALPNAASKKSSVRSNAVTSTSNLYDKDDVRISPNSNLPQSEVHISINPTNSQNLLLSCNTFPNSYSFQGYYYSSDGGQTWVGDDHLPNNSYGRGDPSTAFDASGNGYIESMAPDATSEPDGYYIIKTPDGGQTWQTQVRGAGPFADGDKPMIAADNVSTSPYKNYLYCAWGHTNISMNRSTDGGHTFSTPLQFPSDNCQGANLQTGPNGEVYLSFVDYSSTNPGPALDVKFFHSSDGAGTMTSGGITNFTGIRYHNPTTNDDENPLFNNTRVNDFPSMAVDKSSGPNRGRVYIVVAGKQNGSGKAVIYLTHTDDNVNFSPLKEISISNASQSWFPWISVDDTTGEIYVDYYSFDTSTQWETNTYVAYSGDGGATFSNQKVSDVSHTTATIPGFEAGYTGDYIGIVAHGGKAYATWADDRSGIWQIYVSEVGPNPVITGIPAFCTSSTYTATHVPVGSTVTWSVTPSGVVSLSPTGNQVSLTKITQGYFTLTANISGSYSNLSPSLGLTTQPAISNITYYTSGPCTSGYQSWYLGATPNMPTATNWHWSVATLSGSSVINIQSPNSQNTNARVSGGGQVDVTYQDGCGEQASVNGVTIYSTCRGMYAVTAFPNPANNQFSVQNKILTPGDMAPGSSLSADPTPVMFSVQLIDNKGKVLRTSQNNKDSDSLLIDTSNIANGTYFLHVIQGQEIVEKQIIIQH